MGKTTPPRMLPDYGQGSSPQPAGAGLVALCGDPQLVEILQRLAAPHEVRIVTRESDLPRALVAMPAQVALIDSAATTRFPLEHLTARLRLQFPQLVLIVAGTGNDEATLAPQISRGTVRNFLLKPVSARELKPILDELLKGQEPEPELAAPEPEPPPAPEDDPFYLQGPLPPRPLLPPTPPRRPWWILPVLLVLAGAGFAAYKWFWEPLQTPALPSVQVSTPSEAAPLEELLLRADAAGAQEDYAGAADLYRQAQRLDPTEPRIKSGIDRLVRQITTAAALDPSKAERLAPLAASLAPDNAQVKALVAQTRESTPPPPHSAASAAREPQTRAPDARKRPQLDDLLRHARELMVAGNLVDPPQDNARNVLHMARELSPSDPRIGQQQRELLGLVVIEARRTLALGQADQADAFIAAATELGARPDEIEELQRQAQRDRAAARSDQVADLFNQRMQQGKLVDPPADSAKFYLSQLLKSAPGSPSTQIARSAFNTRLLTEAQGAVRRQDVPAAKRWIAEAREAGADAASLTMLETDLQASQAALAAQAATQASAAAAARPLPLQKYRNVEPIYPEDAFKRRISGVVDMRFTVRTDGTTADFEILSAQPAGIFDQAAINAVRQWRYRPPTTVDGKPTPVRIRITVRFAP